MPLENEPVPASSEPAPAYIETLAPLGDVNTVMTGAILPTMTYFNNTTPIYATSAGAGAVSQVTAGAGLVVAPTTGNVVVSMPAVGSAGAVANPASITTDAQGRVTAVTPLGYTPVNPTALSAYAPLAGATFTGAVSGTTFTGSGQVQGNTVVAANGLTVNAGTADMKLATTVQVPTPTLPASAATKAYVDAAIPSVAGFAQLNAPNTFTANNTFSGAATVVSVGDSAVAPVDTFQVWGKDVNLRNTDATNVFNLTSAGLMSVSAAGGISMNANAAVNMTASIGNASVYSVLGDVNIGGNINSVKFTGNDVNTNGGDIQTGAGVITAGEVNISNGTNTGNVLDSQFNPPVPANTITTKGIRNSFKDQNGNTVFSASLDTTPNLQVVGVWTFAGNTKFNMNTAPNQPALFYNTINTFRITSSGLGPNTGVVLPASPPDGTMVGIFNANDSPGGNFGIFLPDGSTLLKSSVSPGSGFYCQFLGSTWYAEQSIGSFIPLAGTAENAPVTGTVSFEDGNGNIVCADIATALLSAVAPYDFISVTDPMQTRLLGVRSEDGVAPATIKMALSESAVSPEILELTYNPLGNDKLEVNKGMILDGGLIMGAAGGFNNIENALNIYASDTIEGQTLQAIDYVQGGANVVVKTTDPVFTNNEIVRLAYPDSTAQNAVITAQGALSLVDPPNGGLPAQILINGVPQTFGGSDWSSYAATQNVDMASFDINNAGAVGATSVYATDFITSETTITGNDVVASNSVTAGADIMLDGTNGNILATTINTTGTIDADTTISALDLVATNTIVGEGITANVNLLVDGLNVKDTLDFTPTNELFVAKNGSDITGNGSSLQPYATITRAIQDSDAITPKTGICVINIANGNYNDPIFITGANSGYIQLNGASTSQNNTFGVVIDAAIYIQINSGAADLINRQVILSGLQLNKAILNTSTLEHTVIIQNCRLYPSADLNGISIQDFNTAPANRCLVDNCEYTNDYPSATPAPCFNFTGNTTISFSKCDIQSPNDADIFSIAGASYLQRLEDCYIESQFVNPTTALVDIISTSPNFHSIALNVFSFRDSTATTAPAIITQNGGTLLVASNIFDLTGTNPTTGNVIQYSGTAPTLIYGNNTAVPLYASGIQSGITLVPLAAVGSQPIKATTITASGAISGGSVSAGSGALSGGAISGTTVTTTGAIKSSGTLQLSGNAITNASNNTTITGVNAITLAGTTPSITGVNNVSISNTNATTPLTITNSGDNPHIICNNAAGSTAVPVEINLVNGGTTLAYGNQGSDPRGAFFFFNGRDCIRIPTTGRVQMTYSPYSPTLAASGAAGAFVAGTGSFVSGVPKLLGTETITLGVNNLPIIPGGFGTPCYLGLNGYINTCVLTGAGGGGGGSHYDITVSATYTRTRGGVTTAPLPLYGCFYPISILSGAFFSPINGTTYDEATPANRTTFTHGDIITIQVFGTYVGGSPPSIVTPATGLAAVFSPFFI